MMLKFVLVCALLFVQAAHADGMREMLRDAVINGAAEGTAEPIVATAFGLATHSKEPLRVKLKRLKKYQGDCASIAFNFSQQDSKTGEVSDLNFNLPICMDGSTPPEAIDEEKERVAQVMNSCNIKFSLGKKDKDSREGKIVFDSCPPLGNTQIVYEGTCQEIKMKESTYVQFDFDKNGHAEVSLRIPDHCTDKQKWLLHIFEKRGFFPNQIGKVTREWSAAER